MTDPLQQYRRPARPYGATDPVSAIAEAVGAVFNMGAEIAVGAIGAKRARDEQISAIAKVNPCVARVQAQIATLGPKPIARITAAQKKEHEIRLKLESRLRALLADPALCPEVAANKAAVEAQEAANARATTTLYTIGGIGLVGAGVLVYLATRKGK